MKTWSDWLNQQLIYLFSVLNIENTVTSLQKRTNIKEASIAHVKFLKITK